jgi:hypothetical protein
MIIIWIDRVIHVYSSLEFVPPITTDSWWKVASLSTASVLVPVEVTVSIASWFENPSQVLYIALFGYGWISYRSNYAIYEAATDSMLNIELNKSCRDREMIKIGWFVLHLSHLGKVNCWNLVVYLSQLVYVLILNHYPSRLVFEIDSCVLYYWKSGWNGVFLQTRAFGMYNADINSLYYSDRCWNHRDIVDICCSVVKVAISITKSSTAKAASMQ